MLDCAPLITAVERIADRFRALPQSRLRGVAQVGLDLARDLSCAAQRLELPDSEPLLMPDNGIYALGDQIAVAGHDLLAALAGHPCRHDVLEEALRSVAKAEELL